MAFCIRKREAIQPRISLEGGGIEPGSPVGGVGNPRLYGFPLPYPKSRTLSILAIVGIGLGSGFLSLIVSFTAVCVWLRVTEQRLAAEEGKISQLVPEYD